MRTYYVYIATNRSRTLYIGVTNNLQRRHSEHVSGRSNFTAKYNIDRIVYYETYMDIHQAIAREKQIKGWRRSKKEALIESVNPNWREGESSWIP
jgi:putative endonuclease